MNFLVRKLAYPIYGVDQATSFKRDKRKESQKKLSTILWDWSDIIFDR